MLRFDVSVNGKDLARAGVPTFGVCGVSLTWVRREKDRTRDAPELDMRVGGMEGDEFLDWPVADLKAGDTVVIHLQEADDCDPPQRRTREEKGLGTAGMLRMEIKALERRLTELREALAQQEQGGQAPV